VAANAPRDLLLWKSKPLQVLCEQSLYVSFPLEDVHNVTQNCTTRNKTSNVV